MKVPRVGGGYDQPEASSNRKVWSSFDWFENTRKAMVSILPETEPQAAKRYLTDAAFNLYMGRAREGIEKSGARGYSKLFEVLLARQWEEKVDLELEGLMARMREYVPRASQVEHYANRYKGAFWLRSSNLLARRISTIG